MAVQAWMLYPIMGVARLNLYAQAYVTLVLVLGSCPTSPVLVLPYE